MKAIFQRRRSSSKSTSASSVDSSSIDPASPFHITSPIKKKKAPFSITMIQEAQAPSATTTASEDAMDHSHSTSGTNDLTTSFHSVSDRSDSNSPLLTSPITRKRSIPQFAPTRPLLLPSSIVGPATTTTIRHNNDEQQAMIDDHAALDQTPPSFHLEQQIQELLDDIRQVLAQMTKHLLAIQKDASFHWQRALLRHESQQATGVRLSLRKIHALQQTEQELLRTIQSLTDQHIEASRLARKIRHAAKTKKIQDEPWVMELYATLKTQLQDLQQQYHQTNAKRRVHKMTGGGASSTSASASTSSVVSFGEREEALLMEELQYRRAALS